MACISSSVSIGLCIIVMFDLHCSLVRVGWYSIYDCSSRYVRKFIGQRYQRGVAT